MEYTKNYHLPQWAETDRILRTDFNQMCKDIEDGLTQNSTGSTVANEKIAAEIAAANEKTAAEAAAAVQAAEAKAFDQACRLAYNHYSAAQTITPFPKQLGVFYQDTALSTDGLQGFVKYLEYAQMNNAPRMIGSQLLAIFEHTELVLAPAKNAQAMTATFTAPSNGLIQCLHLRASYTGQDTVSIQICDMLCKDLTSNQTLIDKQVYFTAPSSSGTSDFAITEEIELVCGHKYQITVSPRMGYGTSFRGQLNNISFVSGATSGTAYGIHTFQNPPENLGFLAVASYQFTNNCNEPKLTANGEEIPVWWSRTASDSKGNSIREIAFRRYGAVQNNESMQLEFYCGTGETLTLYNWGITLI